MALPADNHSWTSDFAKRLSEIDVPVNKIAADRGVAIVSALFFPRR